MFDEKFWLAISFLAFGVIFKKYAWPFIIKALDNKSKEIANSILEAREMREHAQKLLLEAKKLHEEAEAFSKKTLSDAKNDAEKLALEAREAMKKEIEKISALAIQRVKNEEEKAIRLVKEEIISKTVANLEIDLKNIDNSSHANLLDKAVGNI
jgi:F-type H+-transporting ATPase subunit b